jgi:hypothetical protein
MQMNVGQRSIGRRPTISVGVTDQLLVVDRASGERLERSCPVTRIARVPR